MTVGNTALERRWPGYASAAAAEGIGSLVSIPLVPSEVFRAAVNLYAPWPHVFTSADITAAALMARQMSRTLRLVQQLVQELAVRSGVGAELSSAQLSRVLAGLALRTLVRDFGFSEEGALDYLRSAAGGTPRESVGGTVRVVDRRGRALLSQRERESRAGERGLRERFGHDRAVVVGI